MIMKKIINLKLVILLEYQNMQIFSQKGHTPNWSEVFEIKKVKTLMLLMILTMKELLELFTKKNFKKQIKKSLELKK